MLEDCVIQAKLYFSIIRSCKIEKNILILGKAARRQDCMENEYTGEVDQTKKDEMNNEANGKTFIFLNQKYTYVKNPWLKLGKAARRQDYMENEHTGEVDQTKKDEMNNEANGKTFIFLNQKYTYVKNPWLKLGKAARRQDYMENEHTGEVDQTKKDEMNNEANGKTCIFLNQKYTYVKNPWLKLGKAARRQDYMENEHTGEVDQTKKDEMNNEANGKTFIFLNQKYTYVKNPWLKLNNMTKQVSEPSRRPVIVLDSEESGPVNRNLFNHVTEYTMGGRSQVKTELKTEGHQDKCNELHEGNLQDFGLSKASSDYRKRILNVLKKHRKAYPDLNKKLTRYRYKRLVCITIVRRYFRMRRMMRHSNHGRTLAV